MVLEQFVLSVDKSIFAIDLCLTLEFVLTGHRYAEFDNSIHRKAGTVSSLCVCNVVYFIAAIDLDD